MGEGWSVAIAGLGLTRGHVCLVGGLAWSYRTIFHDARNRLHTGTRALICLLRKRGGVSYCNIIVNKRLSYRLFPFPNFSCHLFFAVTTGAGAEVEDSAAVGVPPGAKRIVLGVGCMYQP